MTAVKRRRSAKRAAPGASVRKIAHLGEVVALAFDGATQYSNDPREVSRLATQALSFILLGLQLANPDDVATCFLFS